MTLPIVASLAIGVGSNPFTAIAVSPVPIWLFGLYLVVHFVPSDAFGVGSNPSLADNAIVGRSFAFFDFDLFILPVPASIDVGVGSIVSGMNSVFPFSLHTFNPCVCTVGNKPYPVPSVRCSDGTSRNKHRLDGISLLLKVSADGFDDVLLTVLLLRVTLSEKRG